MARAWIYQHAREQSKGRSGTWSVGWYENQRKRSKVVGTKTAAREYASNLESRLNTDHFSGLGRISWEAYQDEYRRESLQSKRACNGAAIQHDIQARAANPETEGLR